MRANKVKELWHQDKPAIAGWLSSADTYVAEVMANAGFDALVLDMQHGMGIGVDRAVACLQAISTTDTVPLVRVPWNEPAYTQYVLDAGAYGVIIPLVGNAEEAAKASGACRYPPLGYRSIGPNRVNLYAGGDYYLHANEEIICLIMIEHIDAVAQLEEIAAVPGIDGFYVGPADLAVSMGLPPGQGSADPRHAEACQRVLEVAKARGLVAGIHCTRPEDAARRFGQGFRFCPIGADMGFIGAGARSALESCKSSPEMAQFRV